MPPDVPPPQPTPPRPEPGALSLTSFLFGGDGPPAQPADRANPQLTAAQADEIRQVTGMSPEQFARTLNDPLGRAVYLRGLITALDANEFETRERAHAALSLALRTMPAFVLPVLMQSIKQPISEEQRSRSESLVRGLIGRTTTRDGVTRDGLGRPTAFTDDGWNISINWSSHTIGQADSIYVTGDGANRWNRQHVLQRQADGTYTFSLINPLNGETFPPSATLRAEDVQITSNYIRYGPNSNPRPTSWFYFHWITPPERVNR